VSTTPDTTEPSTDLASRAAHLVPALVLAVTAVGFFTGTGQLNRPLDGPGTDVRAERASAEAEIHTAISYAELKATDLSANANWEARLTRGETASALAPVARPTEAERVEALHERATLRAYMGAPPVVPHRIDQRTAEGCLSCHERGLRLGEVVAPAIPHDAYTNCLQCHAGPSPSVFSELAESGFESRFDGLPEQRQGERAGPGSPPVIPHPTAMRERCTSCHVQSSSGLKTTHPWRSNCIQCHASSSGFAR
jgi:nitrate reductase (cytochrome), electron transfer subunit